MGSSTLPKLESRSESCIPPTHHSYCVSTGTRTTSRSIPASFLLANTESPTTTGCSPWRSGGKNTGRARPIPHDSDPNTTEAGLWHPYLAILRGPKGSGGNLWIEQERSYLRCQGTKGSWFADGAREAHSPAYSVRVPGTGTSQASLGHMWGSSGW